ncbi:LacI family DNA-binding transcriptional regulator [Roseovarius indicus]|nr:LacI family DNA-binding transcriptional regulator [Roseovarius indicus]
MSELPTDPSKEGPSRKRRPTMAEIARLAGVDISTVSRALSGSPRVAKETRDLIDTIVRETGYVVNQRARALRDGKANQVLVISSDIAAPFYSDVVQGIVGTLAEHGINVLLGITLNQEKREEQLGKQLLTGVVDGVITLTGNIPKPLLDIPDLNRRIVAVSRPIARDEVTSVTIDNYAATREVMEYLYAMGHRRILYIGGPKFSQTYQDRNSAYVDFMRDKNLSEFTNTRSTESFREDAETGFEIMASVLEGGSSPTAVFCATDELAIGAMAAARRAGRTIPDDMSFFGFDDLKLTGLMSPPLSTVSVPRFEMGRRGAEALFHQIYEGSDASNKIVLGHHLVLRESVSHI